MAEITVANTEWTIIDDVLAALGEARMDGAAVFAAVATTTSQAQAAECQLTGSHPKAIVRFDGATDREAPDGMRHCAVTLELFIAANISARGADEARRLAEILRLVNAAKNAVEAAAPADACYCGDGARWRNRLQWGEAVLDTVEQAPWALARLPLDVSYTLDDSTSH